MGLNVGDTIQQKYRVVRLLGEGGMGAVYEGENVRIKRKVAIKVLHAQVAKNPDLVRRFEKEAQAAGRIGSRHIVDVIDLGDLPDGDLYMVMEFLEGESLDARIERKKRLEPAELFPIALQLLSGLSQAHQAGIIHRDLKPDNVYLTRDERGGRDFVKILDFGISKFRAEGDHKMTRTGAIMGTPYYLSPEQARGLAELDERADVYSVGVILYHALTGRVPFESTTFNDLLFKIALEDPPSVIQLVPGIGDDVAVIVMRAMARDRDARFQTAAELHQAIRSWMELHGLSPDASAQLPAQTAVLDEASWNQPGLPRTPTGPHFGKATPPTVMQPPSIAKGTAPGLALSQSGATNQSKGPVIAIGVGVLLIAGAVGAVVVVKGGGSQNSDATREGTIETATQPASGASEPAAKPEAPEQPQVAPKPEPPAAPKPKVATKPKPKLAPPSAVSAPSPAPAPKPSSTGRQHDRKL